MRINTNMMSLNAWRNLTSNEAQMTKSLEKLSSGFRINRAADDAAGLAVSEKMGAQIRGLNQAGRNAQDGIAMVQTAEGGAGQIQSMLQRMRELTVQASNGALEDTDRAKLNTEFGQLLDQIDKTAGSISYNNIKLLNGTAGTAGTVTMQIGANDGETLDVTLDSMKVSDLSLTGKTIDSLTNIGTGATGVLQLIDNAIDKVSTSRAKLGAYQNRLSNISDTLNIQSENLTGAQSRIRDVDMGAEMAQYTKFNVLQQASTSMLAQANQATQGVLSLLRG